ncbi:MAG TPA: hypothetical protein VE621_09025, partial [Bryobacteraceae bacterium]|nr:hypothetical protein [Bryobacteraceae bacterium]
MTDINLSSVNFEHGMLLTPEHLIRQERYFDSTLLWTLRYCTDASGLIGAGPRADEAERGAVRHDPAVTVIEEEDHLAISVGHCRAITQSGLIVDVVPEYGLTARVPKADLEGTAVCGIHVVCTPHVKEMTDGPVDEFNP